MLKRKITEAGLLTLIVFSLETMAVAGPGGFVYTGSLNARRVGHTTTALINGLVLVAGGVTPCGRGGQCILSSAGIYNPSTGTFTLTGNLNVARSGATATLLDNGMVLVAGGQGTAGYLTSAELYNPTTGIFTLTGSLHAARVSHTATVLNDGSVLIAGGYCDVFVGPCTAEVLNEAEVYDPTAGAFSVVGAMASPRYQHSATLLNSGRVLIAGGASCVSTGCNTASAELYDPVARSFQGTGNLSIARRNHTATLLNGGGVVVIGGINDPGSGASELYNPATGAFTQTASLPAPRDLHTATLLSNGTVLVAGGLCGFQYNSFCTDVEIFDPQTGSFSVTGNLNQSRYSSTATVLGNGLALVTGGKGSSGITLNTAELYQPVSSTPAGLTSIALAPAAPWIPTGSSLHVVATGVFGGSQQTLASAAWTSTNAGVASVTSDQGNYGHAYGVSSGSATFSACAGAVCGTTAVTIAAHSNLILGTQCGDASDGTFEVYNDAGNLTQSGNFSTLVLANHAAMLLQNGTIFVAGGNGSNCTGSSATWEILSPTGQILSSGLLQNGRNSPASTLLQNGNVFLAGGEGSPASYDGTWEIRAPDGSFVASGLLNDVRGPGVTAVTLQNGNVWVSGSALISSSACTYEIHSPNGSLVTSGSLQSCFAGAQVQLLNNGNVMLLGGDNAPGTYEIRNESGGLVSTGSLVNGFNSGASSVLLENGNVFIFGSCTQAGQLTKFDPDSPPNCPSPGAPSTWEIRDQSGTFVATGSLLDQRAGAGATILSNGNIFITGGGLCPACWEIWTQSGQFVSTGSLLDTRYGGHSLTHF